MLFRNRFIYVSITSVSVDRFLIVTYPIKHRILIEGKLITLWLATIWIVSGLISVLPQVHIHGRNIVDNFGVIIVTLSAIMYYSSTYYKLKKQSKDL